MGNEDQEVQQYDDEDRKALESLRRAIEVIHEEFQQLQKRHRDLTGKDHAWFR